MIYIWLNALPILFAALASLALGALWLKAAGNRLPSASAIALIGAGLFWSASILAGALILAPERAGEWVMAIGSAIVIAIGFVMPAVAITLSVGRAGKSTIVSACLYWPVAMILQAIVMKAWGLTPPPGA